MNFAQGKRERRLYENTALVAVRKERAIDLFWTRRGRKSTTLGSIAFDELTQGPGRTVIAASASLLLGSELVSMTVTATEQAILVRQEAEAQATVFASSAEDSGLQFQAADSESGKVYGAMSLMDFTDLYKSKRLEMRLYFDRTSYSRQLVIAPNPATARGWGGTVLRDEVGFTRPETEIELQMAVDPIFRTDPTFKMVKASNLSRDDRHPWFEETMPPPDMEFEASPAGHFYRGHNGVLVHRVALADAYAAGHVLYDNKGQALTLQQFRADPANRLQLPFNYDLIHVTGGAATIDLVSITTAQARGARTCVFVYVDDDAQFNRGLEQLRELIGPGRVGIGVDPASTIKQTSNPTSITVTEQNGVERMQRLVVVFKTQKRQVMRERLERICRAIQERPKGGPAVRMCIDASNDRLAAEETKDDLAHLIPVELIINGSSVHPPGYQEATNYKTYLGDLYSAAVNENKYAIPADHYVKEDQRMVMKDGSRYVCEPDPRDGKHGDTFDSGKNAEYALSHTGGAIHSTDGILIGTDGIGRMPGYRPRQLLTRRVA